MMEGIKMEKATTVIVLAVATERERENLSALYKRQ
jgi:hypothetical protein